MDAARNAENIADACDYLLCLLRIQSAIHFMEFRRDDLSASVSASSDNKRKAATGTLIFDGACKVFHISYVGRALIPRCIPIIHDREKVGVRLLLYV